MDEPLHAAQIEAFRRATPAQKLQAAADLYATALRLRVAGLRMTHPTWSDEALERAARCAMRDAGT